MDLTPLWISLKTSFTATIIVFILGLLTAKKMCASQSRFKGLLDGLFILPLVLPPTVVGFLLLVLFSRQGFLGQLLNFVGTSVVFTWSATVIAAAVVAFPLMYRTVLSAFEQMDPDMLDAARTLGLTENKIFTSIMIPLARPGILAGTILAFTRALGEFGATLMLAGNIPGRTQTIPMAIFFLVESGQPNQAVIWVLIVSMISLLTIISLHYWTSHQSSFSR